MVDGEARCLPEAHDAQRRRDRTPPRREHGARHQHQGVAPDRGGEVVSERPHPRGQHLGRARRHGASLRLGGAPGWSNPGRGVGAMAGADAMRQRIEVHPWPRDGVEVVRANRGYTLYSRRTGGQVARLRPTGEGDDVQVLWWRGEAWAAPGDFGPVIMPLDEALDFVATESFFWIGA
jgi:hypothetical protein